MELKEKLPGESWEEFYMRLSKKKPDEFVKEIKEVTERTKKEHEQFSRKAERILFIFNLIILIWVVIALLFGALPGVPGQVVYIKEGYPALFYLILSGWVFLFICISGGLIYRRFGKSK